MGEKMPSGEPPIDPAVYDFLWRYLPENGGDDFKRQEHEAPSVSGDVEETIESITEHLHAQRRRSPISGSQEPAIDVSNISSNLLQKLSHIHFLQPLFIKDTDKIHTNTLINVGIIGGFGAAAMGLLGGIIVGGVSIALLSAGGLVGGVIWEIYLANKANKDS